MSFAMWVLQMTGCVGIVWGLSFRMFRSSYHPPSLPPSLPPSFFLFFLSLLNLIMRSDLPNNRFVVFLNVYILFIKRFQICYHRISEKKSWVHLSRFPGQYYMMICSLLTLPFLCIIFLNCHALLGTMCWYNSHKVNLHIFWISLVKVSDIIEWCFKT